jgi:predicted PurR-regulated permease PerM
MNTARVNSTLLFIIAVVAVGSVLRLTGSIFLPLVIALLLSFVFTPLIRRLSFYRVPRLISVFLIVIFFVGFAFLIGLILYQSSQSLLQEFPKYQQRFQEFLSLVIQTLGLPDDILQELDLNRTIGSLVVSFSGNFMAFASGLTLVLIFLLFVLLEQPYLRSKLRQAFRDHATRKIVIIIAHITNQVARYLGVKLFVSALTAVIVFVAFTIIGVDFAFIWMVLTFMFNFIPSIGSIVITIATTVFAVLQFAPDWNYVIATALAMSVTQLSIGNILDPQLLGDRLNVSPVIILLSLLLWGWIWGVMGMFLAVPLTVAIKISFENIPGMEPIGIMMGTGTYRRKRRRITSGRQAPPTDPADAAS